MAGSGARDFAMSRMTLVVAVLLSACRSDAPADDAEAEQAIATDSSTAPAVTADNFFDPGAVQPGDTVLGLTVESKDVARVFEDSVWVGEVVFAGDLVLQGVYQPHYDWPENPSPCFHVNDPASAARIPRFAPDNWTSPNPKTWFCFTDPYVALELLGAPDPPRALVISVDRYHMRREFSDVYDTAELMEMIEVGPVATMTLREP
ncbi:MAG: hypothetical protein EXR95_10630 [Gemmatimonadetes bacterium]|nr:hypothetical protein [Gemmatimonadota bacterium]